MLKLLIPAVLLSALLPNAAMAQDRAHADIHVAYRDLDLQSPAGVKLLDRRIERAIAKVCPSDFAARDLEQNRMVTQCRAVKEAEVAAQRAAVLQYSARRGTDMAPSAAR